MKYRDFSFGHWMRRKITRSFTGGIESVRTTRKIVALTFDDGPDPEYTPRVLDILERHDAKGTFFMIGNRVEQCRHIVRRTAEAGHSIGVHSWDHSNFSAIDSKERQDQILSCEMVLSPFCQKLFRPPFGHLTIKSGIDCRRLGYKVILWSSVIYDWQIHDAAWTARRLFKGLTPGGIILMHDHLWKHRNPEETHPVLSALDYVLGRSKDFSFVTIPRLLSEAEGELR